MIDTLSKMKDFIYLNLLLFMEAILDLEKLIILVENNFEKFVQRQNTGHLSHGK